MRIGMLLANRTFPPDIRVEKEADVLSAAGHESWVLCIGTTSQPAEEVVGNVTALRHRVHPTRPWSRRFDSLMFLLTLDSPSWRRAIESMVRDKGAQAIHVHDLPYIRTAVNAGRTMGVPVVLDMHENYPAAFRLWRRRLIDRLFFPASRAERLEKWALGAADHIIVVVSEARERLIGLGADPERIVVFGNSEPRALAGDQPLPINTDELHLVYVGGVDQHRGLHVAVAAMPAILASHPAARLTIVGDGHSLSELKTQATALGLGESVAFTGWLSKSEAMSYVESATVALIPHERSAHTDSTVPHKLFQYMALARPILVSDCAPLARIVRETGCGDVFTSGDADEFAEKALSLADPERARSMGIAGREAFLDRYNLEVDSAVLLDLYAGLAAR